MRGVGSLFESLEVFLNTSVQELSIKISPKYLENQLKWFLYYHLVNKFKKQILFYYIIHYQTTFLAYIWTLKILLKNIYL